MPTMSEDRDVHHLDSSPGLDLRELIAEILAGWPYILAALIIAYGVGKYLVFQSVPFYTTNAMVQLERDPRELFAMEQGAAAMIGELPSATEIVLMRSRNVLGNVVSREGLDIRAEPVHFPWIGAALARQYRGSGFGNPPWWLEPFVEPHHAWGGEHILVTRLDVPEAWLGRRIRIENLGEDEFRVYTPEGDFLERGRVGENLVIEAGRLGLEDAPPMRIFVQQLKARPGTAFHVWRIPAINAIADVQRGFVARPDQAPGIVNLQFTARDPQLAAHVLTVILDTYRSQNVQRRQAAAETTLEFISERLPIVQEAMETAAAELNRYRVEQGAVDLDLQSTEILRRSLSLESQIIELQQEREENLQRLQPAHPIIQSLDVRIEQIRRELDLLSGKVDELPELQQRAFELQRNAEFTRQSYLSLLDRQQELQIVRAGTIGNIRVVDSPLVPQLPAGPSTDRIMALSLAAGLALALGLIFLLRLLRTGVYDPVVVERTLGLPTYGSIPYSSQQARLMRRGGRSGSDSGRPGVCKGLLAEVEPLGHAMEGIRSLRTALRYAQFDAPDNITVITGPSPDVGKSFVSSSLAATMASAGQSVLLIDADLRRGMLHQSFGMERSPGLSEFIADTEPVDRCIQPTSTDGLFLLSTGTLPPNPAELLLNSRFVQLLKEVSQNFDQVIIDTPPVLLVAESADVARHCGTTLVVLKAGAHPLAMIDETVNKLRRGGATVRGVIFNQMGRDRKGRYYGRYYGYSAGHYYGGSAYRNGYVSRRRSLRLLPGALSRWWGSHR